MTEYNKLLIELVKQSGQELIDRAEELVGESELIADFYIRLEFPQDSIPTIEAFKSVVNRKAIKVMRGDKE